MNREKHDSHVITRILREWSGGNYEALKELMPLVYDELHRQAARFLRRERKGHTLQTSALINEAYLKLVGQKKVVWESRTHFFAIAARAMRQILIDHARTKHREKRGGDNIQLSLDHADLKSKDEKSIELLALDEALGRLATKDKNQALVVELRYFGGLSLDETAEVLAVSRSSVARDWTMAKAWLHREMTK